MHFEKAHPKEDQAFVLWEGQVTEDFYEIDKKLSGHKNSCLNNIQLTFVIADQCCLHKLNKLSYIGSLYILTF